MRIIKRSGVEVTFDLSKIVAAVEKANAEVLEKDQLSSEQIKQIAKNVQALCKKAKYALNVEEIQNLVEDELMKAGSFEIHYLSV